MKIQQQNILKYKALYVIRSGSREGEVYLGFRDNIWQKISKLAYDASYYNLTFSLYICHCYKKWPMDLYII